MKVALCVNEDYQDVELNAAFMEEKIIEASYNDADMIIFPNHSFNKLLTNELKKDVEQFDEVDEALEDIKMFALNYAIHIVFGYDYFDGTKIINKCVAISYEGKYLENSFCIGDYHFSLNDYTNDFVIDLLDKDFVQDKKIFKVNKLYKNQESGGAIYYFNEVIKEIEKNQEKLIYIEFK